MTITTIPTPIRALAGAAALALLLGACSTATAEDTAERAAAEVTAEGPGPADRPDPALAGQPTPTLPPGDPGTDDAALDEPADAHEDDGHADGADGEHADDTVTEVPAAALVDAGTLGALAGGRWVPAGDGPGCRAAAPPGALASRSATLAADTDRLVQVVAAYPTVAASNAAVSAAAAALEACGFEAVGDPRLGTASMELARESAAGSERATVLAAEGVTVQLVATGRAGAPGAWESIIDVALGTSCEASVHRCH